ncbi:hypothetical protein PG985_000586 [Apiospora marii]|uniref:Uncharacterized protein n=1 Tax=Apiospora marii TaxID=335849 RepID=A0ABR1R354_9PEZI
MAAANSESNGMFNSPLKWKRTRAKSARDSCGADDDVVGCERVDVGGATQVPWGKALGNSVDEIDLGWRLSGRGEYNVKRLEG